MDPRLAPTVPMRPDPSPAKRLARPIFFAVWAMLSLVGALAVKLHLDAASLGWPSAWELTLRDLLPWLLLSGPIVWLSVRLPLEWGRLRWSLPAHLLGCALSMAVCIFFGGMVPYGEAVMKDGPHAAVPPHFGMPGTARGSGATSGMPGPVEAATAAAPPSPLFFVAVVTARFNVPIYWALVAMAHALHFFRRSQERGRKAAELSERLSSATLQALKGQLQPHFLFNTLNAIAAFVHTDPDTADEMIGTLSELLRRTLDDSPAQEVSLRREVELLTLYLRIQRLRFGERMRVDIDIDPDLLDALVPTFILQPLVENAVRHGIESSSQAGEIIISARRAGDSLHLAVQDDGSAGSPVDPMNRKGIGLANSRARLNALYGERGELSLHPVVGRGWRAEVLVPFHLEPLPDTGRAA